jgi:hypothetical protein
MDPVTKRYQREFAISMLAYVVILFASVFLIKGVPDSLWRIPLALAPIVPIIFALAAFLRYLSGIDELQQRIQLQAIGFAAGAISMLTFAYGLLENVGLPQLSYVWIFPLTTFLWGVGQAYFSRRYK